MILEEDLTTELLNAQRIVLDHMISNDLKPDSFMITTKLIVAVEVSRLKFKQAKIEKAEKKVKDSNNKTAQNHYQRNKLTENKDSLKKSMNS